MFFERSGLHLFTFRGVEVFLSFWYGFLMAMVVFFWPMMGGITMATGVLWALAITISLLVHDFGHAFMAKRYKLGPTIVLQAFGGFCLTSQEARTDGDDARVLLAGPFTGLLFAGLTALLFIIAPGVVAFSPVTATFFGAILWVSLIWSLANLFLPIYPLDGGRLFHLILRRFQSAEAARRVALNVSIFTVIPVAIIGFLQFGSFLIAFFALYVIMDNVNALQSGRPLVHRASKKTKTKASDFHEELLEDANKALDQQDWREAARLAHHMRSVGSMPGKMIQQVWTILGVATTELGEYEEALSYLQRAPKNSKVKQAIQRCEDALGGKQVTG